MSVKPRRRKQRVIMKYAAPPQEARVPWEILVIVGGVAGAVLAAAGVFALVKYLTRPRETYERTTLTITLRFLHLLTPSASFFLLPI